MVFLIYKFYYGWPFWLLVWGPKIWLCHRTCWYFKFFPNCMYDIAQNDKMTKDNEGKIAYDCLFTVTVLYLFGRTKRNNKVLHRRKMASRDGFEHTHPQVRHISTDYFHSATAPSGPGPLHFRRFTITLRHATLGRTPLDEWSARRRDLYLVTHNAHKRQTSMTLAGFETAIPSSERPQTHTLDRAATVIGLSTDIIAKNSILTINTKYAKIRVRCNKTCHYDSNHLKTTVGQISGRSSTI